MKRWIDSRPAWTLAVLLSFFPPASLSAAERVESTLSEAWWELAENPPLPSPRAQHTAVYDSQRHRMLVFGGWSISYSGGDQETWALGLDGPETWTRLLPNTGQRPPITRGAPGGYDADNDRFVLTDGSSIFWDLTFVPFVTWTRRVTVGQPPNAQFGIFDPARHRFLILGPGFALWELALTGTPTWTQLATSGGTPSGFFLIHDSSRDRMVLAGASQVWSLDLETLAWSQTGTAGAGPSTNSGRSATYDPARDRMVIFGGYPIDELWELSFSGAVPQWQQLTAPGPPARYLHSALFDPVGERIVIFGGAQRGGLDEFALNDTWSLTHGTTAVPKPVEPAGLQIRLAGANPWRRAARLELVVPERADVRVEVLDVRGASMGILKRGTLEAGHHRLEWTGTDRSGRRVAAGVYFVRATSGLELSATRVVLLP